MKSYVIHLPEQPAVSIAREQFVGPFETEDDATAFLAHNTTGDRIMFRIVEMSSEVEQ